MNQLKFDHPRLRLPLGAVKARRVLSGWILVALLWGSWTCRPAERPVEGISDNSFLVEEAYNQEPGVVQHIFTAFYKVNRFGGLDDRGWDLSFTQEWPFGSQRHQLSYTIPYSFIESVGQSDNGIGDVLLNYRYQAYLDERALRAFAPRLSLVLPTGDEDQALGNDSFGLQVNLPFSAALGARWSVHANAGSTFLPDADSLGDRDAVHFNLGASAIYAATPRMHFLMEWVGAWNESLTETSGRHREFESLISPGLRTAFNLRNDAQVVLGLAVPIGLTGSAPDYGVFLYASFEHFFRKSSQPAADLKKTFMQKGPAPL